ncbi:hypothetical protein Ddye_009899 [Dipteronia dyeriana]|uniref:Bromo domain-containing protein n=1 Tax=Dipteronia dyeriana TaxID=168575 RepID=A0AAE0CMP9_9ROSI|nr:hypothetical protein Ddye_009899 [Dipteronia dyeriana]
MSMMWKEGHRRRSPRISGLNNACKAQPMKRVKVGGTTNANAAADHHHRVNGPASRTRAKKKRKLRPLQHVSAVSSLSPIISQQSQDPDLDANDVECGEEEQGHEHHPSDTDKPLMQNNDSNQVTYPDQPSSVPSAASWMPEKRVLQRIIDILQRRDTNEIFAEPVDPKEVEDYYEIVKEPMDFGTMRAKLHEGMYTSLEQFEHDVYLISGNAMHFNSSATIFFRQARAIHELAKKVFQSLKSDPDNFELEFSETRRRSGRRQHSETSGPIHSSSPKLATNLRLNSTAVNVSSKTMRCSLSGSSNLKRSRGNPGCSSAAAPASARDHEILSGAKHGRKTSYVEVDRRCTYIPWKSFLNENDSMSSTIYNNSKTLKLVYQQDIGYKESLMLFVKDLGPTAHMIAERKLQGWSAEASNFRTLSSNSRLQAPKCQILPAFISAEQRPTTSDTTNFSTSMSRNMLDQFRGLETITNDSTGTRDVSTGVSPNNDEKKKIPGEKNKSIAAARELNFSVAGLKDAGSKPPSMKSDKSKWLEYSTLEHCQPDVTSKHSWRNNPSSSSAWPLQRSSRVSTSQQTRGDDHLADAAAAQGGTIGSQFTFDLPYLITRLDQLNMPRQCTSSSSSSGGSILEKMSYQQRVDQNHHHHQSSLDASRHSSSTDVVLQL